MPLAIAAALACAPTRASAQGAAASRVRISVNVGFEAIDRTSTQSSTFSRNAEDTPVTSAIDFKNAALFDVGAGVRVWRHIGVGLSAASIKDDGAATVSAGIPHPFFFGRLRNVAGESAATRREFAAHVTAAWMGQIRNLDVALGIGPTIMRAGQTLVTDIVYQDSYPYDSAAFVSATTAYVARTVIGYNLAADLDWKTSRAAGIGLLVRYTRANVRLRVDDRNDMSFRAGGLQLGGGVRFLF